MSAVAQDDGPSFDEQLSKQALLDLAFEKWDDSKSYFEEIWTEAGHFWDVVAAESYTKAEKKYLEETKRPLIDPPFAAGIIETVIGAELAQQVEPVFHGVDKAMEDEVLADWLTQLVRAGFSITDATRILMDAYHDMLVGGYGFVQWYIDLHRVPFRVVPKALNFWQVWPDPDAVEQNLRDANFYVIESDWRLEDAEANWPEKKEALKKASTGGGKGGSASLPRNVRTRGQGGKGRKNNVTILEFQYRQAVARCRYADPETDEEKDVLRSEYETRKRELDEAADAQMEEYKSQVEAWSVLASSPDPMQAQGAGEEPQAPQPLRLDEAYEEQYVHHYNGYCYRRAFIAGVSAEEGALLEDKEIALPLPGTEPGFTVKAVTGYAWKQRDQGRVRRFGLMRKIVHIQEWFTRAVSLYLEIQSRKVKGGGFAETDAFEGVKGGFEGFVKNSSIPGMWHGVAPGAILAGKIRENPALSGEPGIMELISTMKEMFGWVTGVSQGLQGTMTADRSNVLTENLQTQGLQMLLPIRQPRTAFLLSCGRLFAAIALKHLPAEEIDRMLGVQKVEGMTVEKAKNPDGTPILDEKGKPAMQPIAGPDGQPMTAGRILKQADLLEFDLEADISVATQGEKLRFFQLWNQHGLGQILQTALPGPAGTKVWLLPLLRNSPLPGSEAKSMAAEAEAYLDQEEQAQSAQGVVQMFEEMSKADPEGAQGLLQQLQQIMGGGMDSGQPQEGAMAQ